MTKPIYFVLAEKKDAHKVRDIPLTSRVSTESNTVVVMEMHSLDDALEASELHEQLHRLVKLTSPFELNIFRMIMPKSFIDSLLRYQELTSYNQELASCPLIQISYGTKDEPIEPGEILLLRESGPRILEQRQIAGDAELKVELGHDLRARIGEYFKRHLHNEKLGG